MFITFNLHWNVCDLTSWLNKIDERLKPYIISITNFRILFLIICYLPQTNKQTCSATPNQLITSWSESDCEWERESCFIYKLREKERKTQSGHQRHTPVADVFRTGKWTADRKKNEMTKLEKLTLVKVLKRASMKYIRWPFTEGHKITHFKA